jgi:Yip1 domain
MASTPIPAPAVEPRASISPVGRIVGVIFSPKSTFADIARKPSWLLPVILLAVLGAVVAVALNQKMDWREYMSQQIEKSPRAGALSAEQKQQQIEAGAKFAPVSAYVFGIPAPLVVVLIVAGVMLGAYNLMAGANINYKTALAIVSHAFVPAMLGNLLFLLVLFLKPPGTFDLENPVATNVAVFLPEGSAKWLEALAKNIDILAIWITLLIAAGFAAANPKRLPGNRSFNIAFGVFAVYIVIRMGLAFVLS